MRKTFDTELQDLSLEMISMAAAAEDAIDMVTRSLAGSDPEGARSTIEMARGMEETEREIENHCMRLLLQQQPVARDLRTISAALKMVTDLQRIGDQASNIAELSILLSQQTRVQELADIRIMSQKAAAMVKRAILAYANRDVDGAKAVIALDDEVDELFLKIKQELVDKGVPVSAMAEAGLFDKLVKVKYEIPNDKPEMFGEYNKELDDMCAQLLAKQTPAAG